MRGWRLAHSWRPRIGDDNPMGAGYDGYTHPKTNIFAPENRPSEKETRYSNHPFLGASC